MINKKRLGSDDLLVGTKLPQKLRRRLDEIPSGLDGIDLHLARLRALHPDLKVKFRTEELGGMSRHEKTLLLEDIEHVLGIE
jgi:hypothetical protein